MRRLAGPVALAALLLAACTGGDDSPPPPPPCPPDAAIAATGTDGPVLEGTGKDATLWALFFNPPLKADAENKVVWRMTGEGDLTIVAAGPDGQTIEPLWTEIHGDSSFDRPGEEWGTGWNFPAAGCWTFRATRSAGSGELTVRVAP